jgi:hypothetical protein
MVDVLLPIIRVSLISGNGSGIGYYTCDIRVYQGTNYHYTGSTCHDGSGIACSVPWSIVRLTPGTFNIAEDFRGKNICYGHVGGITRSMIGINQQVINILTRNNFLRING